MIRPRISIRTLLILVSLVGLYFGCWEVTKRFGVEQLRREGTFSVRRNKARTKVLMAAFPESEWAAGMPLHQHESTPFNGEWLESMTLHANGESTLVYRKYFKISSPAPFIVFVDLGQGVGHWYVWCFGPIVSFPPF